MDIISIIMALIVIGVVLYLVETIIPMDERIKRVIQVIVLLAVFFYLFQAMGLIGGHPIHIQ